MQPSDFIQEVKVVEIIFPQNQDRWFRQAALVQVNRRQPTKRMLTKYGTASIHVLAMGRKPLVQIADAWYGEDVPHILSLRESIESSKELKEFSKQERNNPEPSILKYAQSLFPLLGLLPNGYYVLADTRLCPATGERNYFWSVPNCFAPVKALRSPSCRRPYPTFIYPTADSAQLLEHYKGRSYYQKMLAADSSSRAVAFYLQGYLTALLYGHHLASVAGEERSRFPSLVIIPPNQESLHLNEQSPDESTVWFSDISVPLSWFPERTLLFRQEILQKRSIKFVKEASPPIKIEQDNVWAGFPLTEQLMDKAKHGGDKDF